MTSTLWKRFSVPWQRKTYSRSKLLCVPSEPQDLGFRHAGSVRSTSVQLGQAFSRVSSSPGQRLVLLNQFLWLLCGRKAILFVPLQIVKRYFKNYTPLHWRIWYANGVINSDNSSLSFLNHMGCPPRSPAVGSCFFLTIITTVKRIGIPRRVISVNLISILNM